MTDIDQLQGDLLAAIATAAGGDALEACRVHALGKQGVVTGLLKTLGGMTPDERQSEGPRIHGLREAVSGAIAERKAALDANALDARLAEEREDVTMPAGLGPQGSVHPVSQVMDELAEIFADLGFSVATGPEIEDDWHNFTALNIPDTHPARAMHDTFYFQPREGDDADQRKMLLRTHTSPVQIRTMLQSPPPLRIIAPGRTYRSDSDATHTPMFHQVEGLVIDKGIHLGHLKWTLETFVRAFFERDDIVLRMRPSYFPFTEPSAEVDVGYTRDKSGKRVIGGGEPDGWMEILGSGMVHPKVLAACDLDPAEWSGFAFGCGIDRLAMLKYGMDDLRAFFDGDLRWLRNYGFAALDVPTLSGGDFGVKFTLSWLRDHLDAQADATTIAEALTRIGLEVEGVDNAAEVLAPFTIARVLTAERHPQADKLQVLSVDAGPGLNNGGPIQVVCGAPNAKAGLVGIFGPPGAYVPGSDMTLKVAAIRGVESNGMMCSARELRIGEGHDGIVELPADAPVGESYASWAGLDDPVFDVAITPNRQDCMGVRGIARDLAAAGLGTLKPLEVPEIEGAFPSPVEIRTDDPAGCPAFYGRVVRGVANRPSPDWLIRRLEAIGHRAISALVDITNYVMIDLGRPLHVYDLATLKGPLVARKARDGETVVALNGKEYALTAEMTVIADDAGAHDVGGIMGGEHSGVTDATTDVVIECAYFDPDGIARTGQALTLTSDARQRFERGVDPAFLDDGLAIATGLVLDLCGGEPSEAIRAGTPPVEPRTIAFDPARTAALGGIEVPADDQRAILGRLGFTVAPDWTVTVPSWRRDVEGPADLVEEVVRMTGLDAVPSTPLPRLSAVAKPTASDAQIVERRARRAAAARGLHEAVTWSFVSEAEAEPFGGGAWTLANPISEALKVMRPSLLPGLVAAAQRNRARGEDAVRLFELGRRYLGEGEHPTLGLVRSVDAAGEEADGSGWAAARADALAIIAAASGRDLAQRLRVEAPASPWYHPGRSGVLKLGTKPVAEFGELHPALRRAAGLRHAASGAEIFLDALTLRRAGKKAAYAPSPLQPVKRDFAFVLPDDQPAAALDQAIRKADKAVADVTFFDLFRLPDGARSLALRVTLQPAAASFTDADLKAITDRIVAAAAKAGATLRG